MPHYDLTISHITRAEVAAGIASGRPFVVDDGVAHWPAMQRWSFPALAERLKGKSVGLSSTAEAEFGYASKSPTYTTRRVPFEDAIAKVCALGNHEVKHYVIQTSIPRCLPELAEDVVIPEEIPPDDLLAASFWLGGAGCVTPVHYDNSHNLHAQIRGRKRWRLFSPDETHRLYPQPVDADYLHVSQASLLAPDLDRFPLLADAHGIDIELGEGGLLFIPAFWWHHVESLGSTVSVSFWWRAQIQQCLYPNALRPLLPAWRKRQLPWIREALGCAGTADDAPGGLIEVARKLRDRGLLWPAVVAGGTALLGNLPRELSIARWGEILVKWGPLLDAADQGDDRILSAARIDELIAILSG